MILKSQKKYIYILKININIKSNNTAILLALSRPNLIQNLIRPSVHLQKIPLAFLFHNKFKIIHHKSKKLEIKKKLSFFIR